MERRQIVSMLSGTANFVTIFSLRSTVKLLPRALAGFGAAVATTLAAEALIEIGSEVWDKYKASKEQ